MDSSVEVVLVLLLIIQNLERSWEYDIEAPECVHLSLVWAQHHAGHGSPWEWLSMTSGKLTPLTRQISPEDDVSKISPFSLQKWVSFLLSNTGSRSLSQKNRPYWIKGLFTNQHSQHPLYWEAEARAVKSEVFGFRPGANSHWRIAHCVTLQQWL